MSYERNADGELIDISLDRAKRMTVLLYDVPTAADKDARTIMDAADLVLAQQAEIARLRNIGDQLYNANDTIDGLRAALEEITNLCRTDPVNPFLADSMDRIARKALANEEEK